MNRSEINEQYWIVRTGKAKKKSRLKRLSSTRESEEACKQQIAVVEKTLCMMYKARVGPGCGEFVVEGRAVSVVSKKAREGYSTIVEPLVKVSKETFSLTYAYNLHINLGIPYLHYTVKIVNDLYLI